MRQGDPNLLKQLRSHDQGGHHAHIFRAQARALRQGELSYKEKFWSYFWGSLYILYILTSPSAQNREK